MPAALSQSLWAVIWAAIVFSAFLADTARAYGQLKQASMPSQRVLAPLPRVLPVQGPADAGSSFDRTRIHAISAAKENLRAGVTRIAIPQKIGGKTIEREVLIHAPRSIDSSDRYPVLLALHGNGGRHRDFLRELQPFINRGAFVGVYPQGYRRSWNLGEEASTADDVTFVTAVIQELARYKQLDTDAMFAMGVSNGAGMAHKLAIETDHFLAIAAIVTQLTALNLPGDETPAVSVLQVSGDRDPIIPYDGGDSPTGHLFLPAEISSQIWARHNGIKSPLKFLKQPMETRDFSIEVARVAQSLCTIGCATSVMEDLNAKKVESIDWFGNFFNSRWFATQRNELPIETRRQMIETGERWSAHPSSCRVNAPLLYRKHFHCDAPHL